MNGKKLYRSNNRMITGVCAGLAEYFNVDPTIIRLGAVVLSLVTGVIGGVIAYIVASVIIPEQGRA